MAFACLAIARRLLTRVRPGDVMSKFYGESQRRIQALEEVIREAAPSVVFLDEAWIRGWSKDLRTEQLAQL
ncbi:unnamed protein product [Effrenium voratum]|nr:unnamed protein product [Effrenium voratum]